MSPLTAAALGVLAGIGVGYALGRIRPVHRALDWANWEHYGRRPTGLRYAAVWTLLSAENLAWLTLHPVQGWDAWKRRNDPPPPRSPAVRVTGPRIPDRIDEEA